MEQKCDRFSLGHTYLFITLVYSPANVTETVLGDLNSDGTLTPADAAIALQLAATGGWDPAADVDGDRRITSLDALMILQATAGAITL
ncbi:MAG: dockerin type I repeat-containing protein [Euryarchaeota archaeon]|nr:dockerin type I repeat-containing protein [Euryarchaeota archaeon]